MIFVQEYIWRVENPLQKQLHGINFLDSESSLPTICMQRSSVSLDTSLLLNRLWNNITQFHLLLAHSQEGLSVPLWSIRVNQRVKYWDCSGIFSLSFWSCSGVVSLKSQANREPHSFSWLNFCLYKQIGLRSHCRKGKWASFPLFYRHSQKRGVWLLFICSLNLGFYSHFCCSCCSAIWETWVTKIGSRLNWF